MTARSKTYEVMHNLERAGIKLSFTQANDLRRAALTLHRWAEQECGDGDNYKSWAIERDEQTGKPYMAVYPHNGDSHRYVIADRERGDLKRVEAICKASGLHFYHQTDPRGAALRISREPMTDSDYTRGVAI